MRLRELPYLAVFGIAGVAFVQWLYFVSIDRLPIGIALLLEYLAPILIALWALTVMHEPVRRRIWLALALALVGLAFVVEVWRGISLDGLGVAAALWRCGRVRRVRADGRARGRRRDPASLICYGFLFAALFWAIVQPLWRFPASGSTTTSRCSGTSELSLPVWSLMLFVVVVGTMVTFLLVTAALRHISATRVGIIAMLEPVAASAVAFLWLGQSLRRDAVVRRLRRPRRDPARADRSLRRPAPGVGLRTVLSAISARSSFSFSRRSSSRSPRSSRSSRSRTSGASSTGLNGFVM